MHREVAGPAEESLGLETKTYSCLSDNKYTEQQLHTHTHTHTGIYSAMKKNDVGSFVKMWMDLESFTQSEVSQKRKTNIIY